MRYLNLKVFQRLSLLVAVDRFYRLDDVWQGSLNLIHHGRTTLAKMFSSYLKEAMEGRAWLPKGMYVEYDENNELLITVTKEV